MTDREREFLNLGFEYVEGIENLDIIKIPQTDRSIYKKTMSIMVDECQADNKTVWEVQPYNGNYWVFFTDLLEAVKFATPPKTIPEKECLAEIIDFVDNYEEFTGENTENYAWRQGVVHGEQLLADSIKNIIKGHNLKSLAASERVN